MGSSNRRRLPAASARGQRGSALVVVMIILIALLGAGAVAIRLQSADTRSTGLVRQSRDALFCAEAGIIQGRVQVAQWGTFGQWNQLLDNNGPNPDTSNDPEGYPIEGWIDSDDADGDGVQDPHDFEVTVRDNDDGDNTTDTDGDGVLDDGQKSDSDQRLFIVSTCVRQDNVPVTVMEMVRFDGTPNAYRDQAGQGAWGTNNAN